MFAVVTFCILFGMWIVMSGKFDLFHLVLGVLSSGLIACVAIILLSKGFGHLGIMTREDYYDR